jgi:hypothetical protein
LRQAMVCMENDPALSFEGSYTRELGEFEMNEEQCYAKALAVLHGRSSGWVSQSDPIRVNDTPQCVHCRTGTGRKVRRGLHPIHFRCNACRSHFKGWTGTAFQGTHRAPSRVLLLICCVARCIPTKTISTRTRQDRPWLVSMRRRIDGVNWMNELRSNQLVGIRLTDLENECDAEDRRSLSKFTSIGLVR